MEILQAAGSFWDGAEVISVYTRAQAIEDGTLIDVSQMAREAGFKVPVAVTCGLWADINAIPKSKTWEDVAGRLWDVLWMAHCAARVNPSKSLLCFPMILHLGRTSRYTVKLHCGPGDEAEPVITLMKIGED